MGKKKNEWRSLEERLADPKRIKYHNERQKLYYTRINITFVNKTDQDIIEKLRSCKSKAVYLRKLIREDMKKTEANKCR